jgi:hypothetical protein
MPRVIGQQIATNAEELRPPLQELQRRTARGMAGTATLGTA